MIKLIDYLINNNKLKIKKAMHSDKKLNIALIGRSGSGKTTFLSKISQYEWKGRTLNIQKGIKVQHNYRNLNLIYNFSFVDTAGFSNQRLACWEQFNSLKDEIQFFIILVNFHKEINLQKQNEVGPQSWQQAKDSISKLKSWNIEHNKIMVIGNMFYDQKKYQLLSTRQFQLYLETEKIKYYEFNLLQKEQCQQVLNKLIENLSSSSYSKHFKGNTTFNACMIGFSGSGKSSVCGAITNSIVSQQRTTSNKVYAVQKYHRNSNFIVNLIDTPGLNFSQKKTLFYLSQLKEFDFHIYVMDLSDPKGLSYLRMFFDLLLTSWEKSQHTILVIGNKVDKAKIDGCEIRKQLLEGIGQKYRFNYVEINALDDASFCIDYIIDIFSTDKVIKKLIQNKQKEEKAERLRKQKEYRIQQQNLRKEKQWQKEQKRKQSQTQQTQRKEKAKKEECQIM